MCYFSEDEKDQRNRKAKVNDAITLVKLTHTNGFAESRPHANAGQACLVCIASETQMVLDNLPITFQERYGVKNGCRVTFLEDAGRNNDQIMFDNGNRVQLKVMPTGITARVTVIPGVNDEESTTTASGAEDGGIELAHALAQHAHAEGRQLVGV